MSAAAEEQYEQEWDEYEELEESASGADDWHSARESEGGHQRSLALGVIAMTPLLIAYELGLMADSTLPRNHAELALLRSLAPLGDALSWVRPLLVLVGVGVALAICFKRRLALGPSLTRMAIEGAIGAVILGPALAFSMRLFGGIPPELFSSAEAGQTPSIAAVARLFGGAAYEELLFRVLVYGGLFVLARRVALFFGSSVGVSMVLADLVGILGSALAFASLHLEAAARWFGPGGEVYSSPVFLWRVLAGILLALLFRWRGPGVAAWTHALFNLALFLGAGVEVFL